MLSKQRPDPMRAYMSAGDDAGEKRRIAREYGIPIDEVV